jgi:hypothetical protein
LNEQAAQNRNVLHLLHYIPERRGVQFDVIEDVIPLYDVPLSVRMGKALRSVVVAQTGENLPFAVAGDRVEFRVPRVHGHAMIELNWE